MADNNNTEAAAVAELAKKSITIQTIKVDGNDVFLNPPGSGELTSLNEFREKPIRMSGTKVVADAESLIKLVNHYDPMPRFVRFSLSALSVVCVLNHSAGTEAEFEDDLLKWSLKLDRELQLWLAKENNWLSQEQFMEFLEERIEDIVQPGGHGPSQSEVQSVIGDLRLTTDSKFTSTKNLHDGNYVFQSSSQSTPSVEVPTVFNIGLPMFDGDTNGYVFPIRLRYRILEGKLAFMIKFTNFRKIQDTAWNGVKKTVIDLLPAEVPHINVP